MLARTVTGAAMRRGFAAALVSSVLSAQKTMSMRIHTVQTRRLQLQLHNFELQYAGAAHF